MISPSTAARSAVPLLLALLAACNASSTPPTVPPASVLLRNDSPWPGTLQLTGGFAGTLSAAANDISCIAIDTVPQDTALGTATIQIPAAPRVQAFSWSFRTAPYLSVQLSGDSAGGTIVSRIGFSNAGAPCIL
jgi:hypothetical protein